MVGSSTFTIPELASLGLHMATLEAGATSVIFLISKALYIFVPAGKGKFEYIYPFACATFLSIRECILAPTTNANKYFPGGRLVTVAV